MILYHAVTHELHPRGGWLIELPVGRWSMSLCWSGLLSHAWSEKISVPYKTPSPIKTEIAYLVLVLIWRLRMTRAGRPAQMKSVSMLYA